MKILKLSLIAGALLLTAACSAQNGKAPKAGATANDTNTALHLMQPGYDVPYGVPTKDDIKASLDRVFKCVDTGTPYGEGARGGMFRLTSYEWGVTYSGMLTGGEATGDKAYTDYTKTRHSYLAEQFAAKSNTVRGLLNPGALDDCGAITASMIKDVLANPEMAASLRPIIDNCVNYIMNKEVRLADGTLARHRPLENAVWLDDMFMGIPAIAYYGKLTGDKKYYDEAIRQIKLFAEKMWVPEVKLFRHGWIQAMEYHPAYHWGRANGWAILTMAEVLDAVPENYPGRADVLDLFKQHVIGLCKLQSSEGFWHQLLDRNDSYLETSATAIFTYCIAHGINKGWLGALEFAPVVCLGWNAVSTKISEEGLVDGTCVGTGMGFDPAFYYYRPVSTKAAHGYGPVLLAGAETIKMLGKIYPRLNDSAVQVYTTDMSSKGAIFSVK